MTEHEKRIREALEAGPTEGPWVAAQGQNQMANPGTTVHHGSGWGVYSDADEHGPDGADAAFIAACNPAAIRALLADLDAVRGALEQCHSTLTDERLGQWHYMEGGQIYSDFKQAADRADAALKGATHEPEPQDDDDNDDPWLSGDDMMGASG